MILALLVAAGGGTGAVARLLLDGMIRSRLARRFPWGTMTINLTGSLLLGVLAGLILRHAAGPGTWAVLGAGFLGGYTTFSTACVEAVRLVQERRVAAALAAALGTLVGGVAAAGIGMALGLG